MDIERGRPGGRHEKSAAAKTAQAGPGVFTALLAAALGAGLPLSLPAQAGELQVEGAVTTPNCMLDSPGGSLPVALPKIPTHEAFKSKATDFTFRISGCPPGSRVRVTMRSQTNVSGQFNPYHMRNTPGAGRAGGVGLSVVASTFPDWMACPGWGGAFATEGQQYTSNAEVRVDLTLRISYVYIGPERLTPGSVFGVIQMQIATQ